LRAAFTSSVTVTSAATTTTTITTTITTITASGALRLQPLVLYTARS